MESAFASNLVSNPRLSTNRRRDAGANLTCRVGSRAARAIAVCASSRTPLQQALRLSLSSHSPSQLGFEPVSLRL